MALFVRLLLAVQVLLIYTVTSAFPSQTHEVSTQHVLQDALVKPRKLHGKFLHITDIHPDPFYRPGSNPFGSHPCHKGKGQAGYFGAEKTECDTPLTLVNATFDWINEHIKDDVDFVVWTGDSARHDNDEKYPRTNQAVEELNEFIVTKFKEVFGRDDRTRPFEIPIIPTFGNNDILPHNIFTQGPNRWTRKFLDIWETFIPQEQRHSFARGGYFYTEVIPNKLAVFSLNTLYFFDSNGAVDGCDDPHEPGYEHFEWLRVQLESLRNRGMKVILTGHVPPARTASKQNWDESCHQKYILWLRQYRDVIVSSLFGHMNLDHFMLQDVRHLKYKFKIDDIEADDQSTHPPEVVVGDHRVHAAGKPSYLAELRDFWSSLPVSPKNAAYDSTHDDVEAAKNGNRRKRDKFLKEIGGPFGERFSLSLVAPSVVPNFFPTLRIVKYNATGLEDDHPWLTKDTPLYRDHSPALEGPDASEQDASPLTVEAAARKRKHKKKKGREKKPNFTIPDPPAKTAQPGPAYSPQTFSLISWRQLYANLTRINAAVAKDLDTQGFNATETSDETTSLSFKSHFAYEQEYHTKDDKVYHMKDLTMRSWLNLAEKIGRPDYRMLGEEIAQGQTANADGNETDDTGTLMGKKKKKKEKGRKALKQNRLWHAFVRRAFVSSKSDDELQDDFG